jgi:Leucine-rich repeat (LRR) protein
MSKLEYSFDNILKSYIDTGIQLPDHQLNLISSNKNMAKTYIRKRGINLKKTGFKDKWGKRPIILSDKESKLLKKYDKKIYDDYINYMSNFKWLGLDDIKLTSLPDWIENLTNLGKLVLGENQLTTLPGWIGNLTNLEELYLFNNELESLPDSIGNLKNLWMLDLAYNKLTSLPKSIGKLKELNRLSLVKNPMSDEEKERIRKLLPNTRIYF